MFLPKPPVSLASFLALIYMTLSLVACGGGSSSSGLLIEGTLTQGGDSDHAEAVAAKHSAGERIENVLICALGECSTTDELGQWGFVVGDDFTGGEVLFSINGHGIDTTTVVDVPGEASDVFLELLRLEGGTVKAEHITVDGETSHHEDEGHHQD